MSKYDSMAKIEKTARFHNGAVANLKRYNQCQRCKYKKANRIIQPGWHWI